eukprot:3941002-Rhodomonas_salina.1
MCGQYRALRSADVAASLGDSGAQYRAGSAGCRSARSCLAPGKTPRLVQYRTGRSSRAAPYKQRATWMGHQTNNVRRPQIGWKSTQHGINPEPTWSSNMRVGGSVIVLHLISEAALLSCI